MRRPTGADCRESSGQFPAVTLSFNLAPGIALGDAVNAIQQMEQKIQMPETIHGSFREPSGVQQSLGTEPFLILRAHRGLYRARNSLRKLHSSITILSTLPSAGVGACSRWLSSRRI